MWLGQPNRKGGTVREACLFLHFIDTPPSQTETGKCPAQLDNSPVSKKTSCALKKKHHNKLSKGKMNTVRTFAFPRWSNLLLVKGRSRCSLKSSFCKIKIVQIDQSNLTQLLIHERPNCDKSSLL